MLHTFLPKSRLLLALSAAALTTLYGCAKHEAEQVRPAATAAQAAKTEQAGITAWKEFLGQVEAGTITDPKGQYVSKSTQVASTKGERPTRPKFDATKRPLSSLPASGAGEGSFIQPIDPDGEGGGGGGGGYTPNYSHFSSTEIVQPWDVAPATKGTGATAGTQQRTNGFYTTENPNGYLYDLKITKGTYGNRAPFHDNPKYHNIPIDLNEGAGGDYIYVSFTRDPSAVEYEHNGYGSCGDEQPKDNNGNYVNRPITGIDTEVRCCNAPFDDCHAPFTPMYALSNFVVNSHYFTLPDLNDGAGGSYIYAWQTRDQGHGPIELGVVTGNNVNIQPPLGWTRVGSDLNNGCGGSYIFFCVKNR